VSVVIRLGGPSGRLATGTEWDGIWITRQCSLRSNPRLTRLHGNSYTLDGAVRFLIFLPVWETTMDCTKYRRLAVLVLLVTTGSVTQAALTTYTYTGTNFRYFIGDRYTQSHHMTFTFTIDGFLPSNWQSPGGHDFGLSTPIIEWSADDGLDTAVVYPATNENPHNWIDGWLRTDAKGSITSWLFASPVAVPDPLFPPYGIQRAFTSCSKPNCMQSSLVPGYYHSGEFVQNGPSGKSAAAAIGPGVWTVTSSIVPIPGAFWLFGSALCLMGVMRRKVSVKYTASVNIIGTK